MAFAMTQGRLVRSALAGFVRVGDGIVLRHIRCRVLWRGNWIFRVV
jgi:hypothetical protein